MHAAASSSCHVRATPDTCAVARPLVPRTFDRAFVMLSRRVRARQSAAPPHVLRQLRYQRGVVASAGSVVRCNPTALLACSVILLVIGATTLATIDNSAVDPSRTQKFRAMFRMAPAVLYDRRDVRETGPARHFAAERSVCGLPN